MKLNLEDATRSYLIAMLWSESDEDGGDNLIANYSITDMHHTALTDALEDCKSFLELAAADIAQLPESYGGAEQVGHDFLLTRNGPGAGFWDRCLGELGDRLTERAESYGPIHAFVDSNGNISTERG